jgi:hypothetical protein
VIRRALNLLRGGLALVRLLPAYVLLGLLKHMIPLGTLARRAWSAPAGRRDAAREQRLAASVLGLSRRLGLPDRDCVQRSLLLYRVLSHAGADPRLIVGFRRVNGRVAGHTWVTVDGRPVLELEADLLRFKPAVAFGAGGTVVWESPPSSH